MAERMTWEEIVEAYPDQWVGLANIEYKTGNRASIQSAEVVYTDKTKFELSYIQLETDNQIKGYFTTPDTVFQLGMLG